MSRRIEYVVDLDERGEFAATVYDGDTVITSFTTDDMRFLHECCGLKHSRDFTGLREYMVEMGIMDSSDTLSIIG